MAQHLVADRVAVAVVDDLEVIDVDHDHRDAALRALGAQAGALALHFQPARLSAAGQRIQRRQAAQRSA
jgi:hypothetical protein